MNQLDNREINFPFVSELNILTVLPTSVYKKAHILLGRKLLLLVLLEAILVA